MTKAMLERLFDATDGVCTYCACGTYLARREPEPEAKRRFGIPDGLPGSARVLRYREASREHVVRRADGGPSLASNIVLACAFCNSHRGEATPEHHRAAMLLLVAAGMHPNHQPAADAMRERMFRRMKRLAGAAVCAAPALAG